MSGNIGRVLHAWAQRDPTRTAIVDAGRAGIRLSYAALDEQASQVAACLRAQGLRAGDRVAICTDNGLAFVAAWFGAVYSGCTTLPMHAGSTAHEISFRLSHAGCKAMLVDRGHLEVAEASRVRAGTQALVLDVDACGGKAQGTLAPVTVGPDALAMILYTSGTTGAAKGVCITHASLTAHTAALVEHALDLGPDDRVLGTLPLAHSYGIRMTLLVPFHAGAQTLFVPKFSAQQTLELCASHGVTWLPAVPTMLIAWANEPQPPRPSALRWCLSAGAPLPEDARLRAEERLGAPVRQGYGLTEATFSAMNAPPDDAAPGSVGKPVAGVEIQIADEAGRTRPAGERGEVLIRGPNVMAGYLDDLTATRHVMRGGWMHSGDVGWLDEAGRLTIVDRTKDLILRGGHSIYPSEVEEVLAAHPSVAAVTVVSQADAYYGEEVVAVVVCGAPLTANELDHWARERLASYKVPHRIAFVDRLPHSAAGKTLKRVIQEQLASGAIASVPATTSPEKPTPSARKKE